MPFHTQKAWLWAQKVTPWVLLALNMSSTHKDEWKLMRHGHKKWLPHQALQVLSPALFHFMRLMMWAAVHRS